MMKSHSLTNPEPRDIPSRLHHHPGTFVAQNAVLRDLAGPDVAVFPEVHVAAADARGAHMHETFSRTRFRDGGGGDEDLVRGVGRDGCVGWFAG